jgi:hypothetical protein
VYIILLDDYFIGYIPRTGVIILQVSEARQQTCPNQCVLSTIAFFE